MFKKILFATNASPSCDAAAKIAFELAEKYASELILFHVVDVPSHGNGDLVTDHVTGEESVDGLDSHDWLKEKMKNIYDTLIQKYGEPVYEVAGGIPSSQILQSVGKNGVDCIIMGGNSRQDNSPTAIFRGIAGSTLQKVALLAKCPVLILSRPCETCFWYFNQIVFGTDFSNQSMSAFYFAYKMAHHIGCKLHLFHVLDIDVSQAGFAPGQEFIEAQIKEAKAKMEGLYVSRMENFDNYTISVREGIPHVELLKFARETSGDLIVMAHHTKNKDLAEAVMGSTMEQVVLRSACPVASISKSG